MEIASSQKLRLRVLLFMMMPASSYAASFPAITPSMDKEWRTDYGNTLGKDLKMPSSTSRLYSMGGNSISNMEKIPIPVTALLFGPTVVTLIGLVHWRKSRIKRG